MCVREIPSDLVQSSILGGGRRTENGRERGGRERERRERGRREKEGKGGERGRLVNIFINATLPTSLDRQLQQLKHI